MSVIVVEEDVVQPIIIVDDANAVSVVVVAEQGPVGSAGPAGSDGADGQGVPTGGSAGQVLSKIDGTNFNTQWVTPSTGVTEDTVIALIVALSK